MADRAKHAFGNLADVQAALDAGKINAYDILFLDGDTEPKVGWIDKNGVFRLVENETDLSAIEAEIATKVSADEVDVKIDTAVSEKVEVAMQDIETIVNEKVEEKIAEVDSAYEIIEF